MLCGVEAQARRKIKKKLRRNTESSLELITHINTLTLWTLLLMASYSTLLYLALTTFIPLFSLFPFYSLRFFFFFFTFAPVSSFFYFFVIIVFFFFCAALRLCKFFFTDFFFSSLLKKKKRNGSFKIIHYCVCLYKVLLNISEEGTGVHCLGLV